MSHMLLLFERTGENCSMLVAFDKLIYFSFFGQNFGLVFGFHIMPNHLFVI